jgi:hypothetical protein
VFDRPAVARRSRVWLDGVEVTHDCQIAIANEPDEAGAVLLIDRNAAGRAYIDPTTRTPARAWHRGAVVVVTT